MKRHGNGGEILRDRVEEGARAVREGMEETYERVRDRAADVRDRAAEMGTQAVGFAKDHPLAIIGSVAVGIGIGFLVVKLLRS